MIFVIIGIGLLLIAIGFIVNVNNARYLLSGYNTISEEDRKKVDIHNLIPYLKRFHLFLGISLIIIGVNLVWLFGEVAGALFLAFYPIVAYLYFIIDSRKFSPGLSHKVHWVSAIILVGTLAFLGYLFYAGLREDRLLIAENTIAIEGYYGSEIAAKDIRRISLVDSLPTITLRTNGFAVGTIRKGYFRTGDGEKVKLILNSHQIPCILITLASGEKIFYASRREAAERIYNQLRGTFPEIAE